MRVDGAFTRPEKQPIISAPSNGTSTDNTNPGSIDTGISKYPESLRLDLSSPTQPSVWSASMPQSAHRSPSHAEQGEDLYFEGTSATKVTFPSSEPSLSPATVSPVRQAGVTSPTQSIASPTRDQSFVTLSSTRSVVVSPTGSILVSSPMGSPVAMSTSLAPHTSPTSASPSYPTMVPFPLAEDNGYTSDDVLASRRRYYSRSDAGGYDTPTLYTGTTNTSPSLSVTRVGAGEAPPALRLGPGIGTHVHANAPAGRLSPGDNVEGVIGSRSGAGMGFRRLTTDSGVSGVDKDGAGEDRDSYLNIQQESHAESSGRSLRAESSMTRSFRAESSDQSTRAESSSVASGIRARVTSLRAPLSGLIPAFMKRARRKSSRMRDDDGVPRSRGRTESISKRVEGWVGGDAQRRHRADSSCARTESSRAQSPHPASDDEQNNISPSSSHLDLLSADPFASTVAFKVGAWSQMYAGRAEAVSTPLPRLPDLAVDRHAQSEYSGSVYGEDDSEEESSIRIYSHRRGRSLSQPDLYTIPIEPLHRSTPTSRAGRALDRRRGIGNWRRPALPARPSLPSLSTLTRRNVVVPIPRSAAAARFPAEPWDNTPRQPPVLGPPTRGLASLTIPPRVRPPPVRSASFPRSPMRSLIGIGSENSIAEDEDENQGSSEGDSEDEDEDDECASQVLSGGEEGRVWWSGPSSRMLSRKNSFTGSVDEPTVSRAGKTDPIVRDSTASTIHARESLISEASEAIRDSMISSTSHEEIDVSSEAFLQTLDELDHTPLTPPPSGRTSAETSVEDESSGSILDEGAGTRSQAVTNGSPKQGNNSGWQGENGGQGYQGNNGSGNGGNGNDRNDGRQAPEDSDETESGSESEERVRRVPSSVVGSQSMPRPPPPSDNTMNRQHTDSSDESDDVPLAQRLPTALKAQKSIRLQDKADREERRQRRLERMQKRAAERGLPTGGEGGVVADDLAKRLLGVQLGPDSSRDRSLSSPRTPMRMSHEPNAALLPAPGVRSRTTSNVSHATRSKTHTRNGSLEQQTPNPPPAACSCPYPAPPMPASKTALSRNGTLSRPRASQDSPREAARNLTRSGTMSRHRGGTKTDDEGESSRVARSRSIKDPSGTRPPMPPMPPMETLPVPARNRRPSQPEPYVPPVVEQRIYIGDRQRFIVVDIGAPSTSAGDVLEMAKIRGELDVEGPGGWQLWEQSNECGMERPVRDFELIADVLKAWNPEKRVNVLIIRHSPFCSLLKPENIPSSSPLMAGWVMWVSKPGKWSKRWLELKEHGLFVSKNEKGKDRTYLCNLSHFDGYVVTHVPRAPKPYVFAAKSIDLAGVFEKEEDSSHIFSCDGEAGESWLARILLARSYIIQQERTVLFRPANAGSALTSSKSMLTRSGTKKSNGSSRAAGPQYPAPLVQDLNPSPFAQGSLLARAAANRA
ncbi:Cell surface glycoprotein 1 [Rhizoctonia solani]|uniref:Cell surface glycoprotein 1 n=1 Tax=Rhizoctonia solani TaxID=456999 RepID=A0A0K6FRE6_9AGAM|nr:Cell surface glycoprotein 1 [Rhizoctonia solani]